MEPLLTVPDYTGLYATMTVHPGLRSEISLQVRAMTLHRARYAAIAAGVSARMPWWFVALTHLLECNLSFSKHLHNGDWLQSRTVREPVGRPVMGTPPFSFEASATDALRYQKLDRRQDWTIPAVLQMLEQYNGMGYWQYHQMPSPYLWSGTGHYTKGKYTEVLRDPRDRRRGYKTVWDPELVSRQIGCAPLIQGLLDH
jgi:lysozyme family protein